MIFHRIVAILIGYCFGNISPGRMFARVNHIDLSKKGSGNVGSTNVARSIGFKVGLLTLFCDCLKAIVPALLVFLIFRNFYTGSVKFLCAYASFGAVMGHVFPAAFGFKGGKGIASSLGFAIVAAPLTVPSLCGLFLLIVFITRYVSLGSVICVLLLPVEVFVLTLLGKSGYPPALAVEVVVLTSVNGLICVYKHKENLKRLVKGEENKFTIKK